MCFHPSWWPAGLGKAWSWVPVRVGRVYDSGTWTKFGIDSERTRGAKVGKGAEITHVAVLGPRSCPSQGAPSLPLRVLPHLAIGPTPAAKLALGAGWHPHPAGPPTPSARAALFDPAFCAHSFSLGGVRASVPREGPEIGAKTAPPTGIRSPTAGLGKVGAGAALWGGGVARAWRQDGSQVRPGWSRPVRAMDSGGLARFCGSHPRDPQSLAVPGQLLLLPSAVGARPAARVGTLSDERLAELGCHLAQGLDGGGREGAAGPGAEKGVA